MLWSNIIYKTEQEIVIDRHQRIPKGIKNGQSKETGNIDEEKQSKNTTHKKVGKTTNANKYK